MSANRTLTPPKSPAVNGQAMGARPELAEVRVLLDTMSKLAAGRDDDKDRDLVGDLCAVERLTYLAADKLRAARMPRREREEALALLDAITGMSIWISEAAPHHDGWVETMTDLVGIIRRLVEASA